MKKYCVYREDDQDELMGWFHTKKEAQEQIKESKRFIVRWKIASYQSVMLCLS